MSDVTSVSSVAFWVAKAGNAEREWEDHFALDEELCRFAVADGASSSSKAAAWAATLTRGFVIDPFDLSSADDFDRWIERRCNDFRLEHPVAADDEVTAQNWYAKAAEGQNGFATLVAAQFGPSARNVESVEFGGVGDACLFHVRDQELLCAAPELGVDGFGTFPDLLSTNDDHREQAVQRMFTGSFAVAAGDEVFLMSDAIAEWSLKAAEAEPEVWGVLSDLDHITFHRLVADLRAIDEIVNDDVTLVRCRVVPSEEVTS